MVWKNANLHDPAVINIVQYCLQGDLANFPQALSLFLVYCTATFESRTSSTGTNPPRANKRVRDHDDQVETVETGETVLFARSHSAIVLYLDLFYYSLAYISLLRDYLNADEIDFMGNRCYRFCNKTL